MLLDFVEGFGDREPYAHTIISIVDNEAIKSLLSQTMFLFFITWIEINKKLYDFIDSKKQSQSVSGLVFARIHKWYQFKQKITQSNGSRLIWVHYL